MPVRDLLAELGEIVTEVGRGTFTVDARAVPLAEVAQAWHEAPTSRQRLVLVP